MTEMSRLQRVDTFARQQKRYWVAEARRSLKTTRHEFWKACNRTGVRVSKGWQRRSRRASHVWGMWARKLRRPWKITIDRIGHAPLVVKNLSRKLAFRIWGMRRPIQRWRVRRKRVHERWSELRVEISLEQEMERLADAGRPIVVGPWVSEVGYEALYWVPFVRWFASAYHIRPDRLLILSRGGTASWYADITPNYLEIFDRVTPAQFAAYNAERSDAPGGTIKQWTISPFEQRLVDQAQAEWGVSSVSVLHPSLMYQLFRQFWAGNRPLGFADGHTLYRKIVAPPVEAVPLPGLPDNYVAVKLYAAQSLQDTPDTRRLLRGLLAGVAEKYPIVLLDTGLALDEHGEFAVPLGARVISAREWMTPQDNLAVQTRIIANATAFIGTCGSIAWLAPMLGTDTTAVMTDAKFLNVHLHLARRVYRLIEGGRFTPFDLGALAPLGLGLAALPSSSKVDA
jgi:hypothetical protein